MKHLVIALAMALAVASIALATENRDQEKDWCLLGVASKCTGTTTIDLVDKIRRLQIALQKGEAVYTPQELNHLQQELIEALETRELLLRPR